MDEKDILKEIKQLDNYVTEVTIPLLKDTIKDRDKTISKLILVIILLAICLFGISGYSIYKYNDFLSQFEFEATDYVYSQDSSSVDGDSVINDGININK